MHEKKKPEKNSHGNANFLSLYSSSVFVLCAHDIQLNWGLSEGTLENAAIWIVK